VLNASGGVKVGKAIHDLTGGGAHLSIDALGHSITAMNSIKSLRRRGRHVQVGLMLDEHAHAPVPMARIIAHELEIKGSHGMQAHRYPEMLRMVARGVLQPQKLVGKHITLDEAPAALIAMDRFEGVGITIIRP